MLQTHTEAYILHFDKIITAAARKIGRPLPKNMHSLDSFIPPFDVPLNFYLDENLQVDLRARRAIVLAGAAGTRKTGRAFSEFARPLEVATVDVLRYIVWSGERATTHLVFEEFNFEAFFDNVKVKDRVSEAIRLLDSQEQHTLKARFSDIEVPAVPRIFTTNKKMLWPHSHIFPSGANEDEQDAIMRRFRTIHIRSDIRKPSPQQPGHGGPQQSPAKRIRL